MRRPFALALTLALATAHAEPRAVVSNCAAQLPPATAGLDALEAGCPGLRAALEALELHGLLAAQPPATLTAAILARLAPLAPPIEVGRKVAPDPARVQAAVASLQVRILPRSAWERFKDWVRRLLERDADQESGSWLAMLRTSQAISALIIRVLLLAVVVFAFAMIVSEAREWRRSARRAGQFVPASDERPLTAASQLTLAGLMQQALVDRPRYLLQLIVEALARSGRLSAPRSLTHQQLAARVASSVGGPDASFAALATVTERQLYGQAELAPAAIEPIVEDGIALYSRLTSDAADPG